MAKKKYENLYIDILALEPSDCLTLSGDLNNFGDFYDDDLGDWDY